MRRHLKFIAALNSKKAKEKTLKAAEQEQMKQRDQNVHRPRTNPGK